MIMISYRLIHLPAQHHLCPRCSLRTSAHVFNTSDGVIIESHHCPQHGDIVPTALQSSVSLYQDSTENREAA